MALQLKVKMHTIKPAKKYNAKLKQQCTKKKDSS
jgi:hypothetical protein